MALNFSSQFLPAGGSVNLSSVPQYSVPPVQVQPQMPRYQPQGMPVPPQGVPNANPYSADQQQPLGPPQSQQQNQMQTHGPNGNAWGWRRQHGMPVNHPGNYAHALVPAMEPNGGFQSGPGMGSQHGIDPQILQELLARRMAERGLGGGGRMGMGGGGMFGGYGQDAQPQPVPNVQFQPSPGYQPAPSPGFYAYGQQPQFQPSIYDLVGGF